MDIFDQRNSRHDDSTESDGSDDVADSASSEDGFREPLNQDIHHWGTGAHNRPTSGWRDYLQRLLGASRWSKTFARASYQSVGDSAHDAAIERSASVTGSVRDIMFSSKLNALIVFVPIGVVTHLTGCPPAWIFATNAIAIVPLSALLTDATERIAADSGDTIGALLNISLGNLVELILFVALANGHVRVVESSILGSILVNILLILGSALLACSLIDAETSYSAAGTQILGSLLFVSSFVFLMPTAFQFAFRKYKETTEATLMMSRITACVVLVIYVLYVFHELKSPKGPGGAPRRQTADPENQPDPVRSSQSSMREREMGNSTLPPRTIRFAEEDHPNSADADHQKAEARIELGDLSDNDGGDLGEPVEDRGRSDEPDGRRVHSAYRSNFSSSSRPRSISLGSGGGHLSRDSSANTGGRRTRIGPTLPTMRAMRSSMDDLRPVMADLPPARRSSIERTVSIMVLIISSALMSMNAEFLVSTIDQITHEGHLSEAMIGLIILPIVGNMAEYITVVTVAVREKLDLAIAVSVGSSIQIALCVAPLTVLAGWILDRDLLLTFNFFEMATLIGTVLLVNIIILSEGAGDTTSNALRGGLVCGCYAIIGIGAFLAPE